MGNAASEEPVVAGAPSHDGVGAADHVPDAQRIQEMDRRIRRKLRGGVKYNMKVVIRGATRTGKSALLARLQGRPFPEKYSTTRGIQNATINWTSKDGEDAVKVDVWDVVDSCPDPLEPVVPPGGVGVSSHQAPLDANIVDVYRDACGAIFMVDPDNPSSFEYVESALDLVPRGLPIVILVNFRDRVSKEKADEACQRARQLLQVHVLGLGGSDENLTRAFPASMQNCFGLRLLYHYLNVPFLRVKQQTLAKQLELATIHLHGALEDVDEMVEGADFDKYAHHLGPAGLRAGSQSTACTSEKSQSSRLAPASEISDVVSPPATTAGAAIMEALAASHVASASPVSARSGVKLPLRECPEGGNPARRKHSSSKKATDGKKHKSKKKEKKGGKDKESKDHTAHQHHLHRKKHEDSEAIASSSIPEADNGTEMGRTQNSLEGEGAGDGVMVGGLESISAIHDYHSDSDYSANEPPHGGTALDSDGDSSSSEDMPTFSRLRRITAVSKPPIRTLPLPIGGSKPPASPTTDTQGADIAAAASETPPAAGAGEANIAAAAPETPPEAGAGEADGEVASDNECEKRLSGAEDSDSFDGQDKTDLVADDKEEEGEEVTECGLKDDAADEHLAGPSAVEEPNKEQEVIDADQDGDFPDEGGEEGHSVSNSRIVLEAGADIVDLNDNEVEEVQLTLRPDSLAAAEVSVPGPIADVLQESRQSDSGSSSEGEPAVARDQTARAVGTPGTPISSPVKKLEEEKSVVSESESNSDKTEFSSDRQAIPSKTEVTDVDPITGFQPELGMDENFFSESDDDGGGRDEEEASGGCVSPAPSCASERELPAIAAGPRTATPKVHKLPTSLDTEQQESASVSSAAQSAILQALRLAEGMVEDADGGPSMKREKKSKAKKDLKKKKSKERGRSSASSS
jgi:GTPase SAR1 family protein